MPMGYNCESPSWLSGICGVTDAMLTGLTGVSSTVGVGDGGMPAATGMLTP